MSFLFYLVGQIKSNEITRFPLPTAHAPPLLAPQCTIPRKNKQGRVADIFFLNETLLEFLILGFLIVSPKLQTNKKDSPLEIPQT